MTDEQFAQLDYIIDHRGNVRRSAVRTWWVWLDFWWMLRQRISKN